MLKKSNNSYKGLINKIKMVDQEIQGKDAEGEKDNNSISVGDFSVMSTTASLTEVEATMNRMIEKHKDFADNRRKKRVMENQGMIG